ncbi:unnamed protein product [Chondrus crispus]|uniref:Uncharacterized protein n=1 Tax=Chondrus crispus TaxID=2769 RepID=R7QNM5_CHOCR|nr:unnamed protein product [Chondrus crispus]CDF40102.1 unnamed protein product [Chondrus crispus]|eukprot:XP_005710396.1 unnamed protein product [Chondrus crispus]
MVLATHLMSCSIGFSQPASLRSSWPMLSYSNTCFSSLFILSTNS